MKRVENPKAILDLIDSNMIHDQLTFKNTSELHEYLRKNPDKRLLPSLSSSSHPELVGAVILDESPPQEEEKG